MSLLLEKIGLIILQILSWIGELSIALIQNPIFDILIAVIIFTLLINLLISIIKGKKDYKNWKKNYSQNARDMEEEEYNDFLDSYM